MYRFVTDIRVLNCGGSGVQAGSRVIGPAGKLN